MRENRLRSIWQEGGAAINGWLHVQSSFSAEIMAHAGWDSLTIDLQHGAADFTSALFMLQAISTTDSVPLARVPWNEPGLIMRLLDAGCYGIICPMVNSREDAEAFVGACRYPPVGYRSYGPFRATLYAGTGYAEHADEVVVTMARLETKDALDNLEYILSVPGLDAIFVGPADLSQSLGSRERIDVTEPEVVAAIGEVLKVARRHDVVPGIYTGSLEYASRMIEKGFQFVTVASDARLMAAAAAEVVSSLKGE